MIRKIIITFLVSFFLLGSNLHAEDISIDTLFKVTVDEMNLEFASFLIKTTDTSDIEVNEMNNILDKLNSMDRFIGQNIFISELDSILFNYGVNRSIHNELNSTKKSIINNGLSSKNEFSIKIEEIKNKIVQKATEKRPDSLVVESGLGEALDNIISVNKRQLSDVEDIPIDDFAETPANESNEVQSEKPPIGSRSGNGSSTFSFMNILLFIISLLALTLAIWNRFSIMSNPNIGNSSSEVSNEKRSGINIKNPLKGKRMDNYKIVTFAQKDADEIFQKMKSNNIKLSNDTIKSYTEKYFNTNLSTKKYSPDANDNKKITDETFQILKRKIVATEDKKTNTKDIFEKQIIKLEDNLTNSNSKVPRKFFKSTIDNLKSKYYQQIIDAKISDEKDLESYISNVISKLSNQVSIEIGNLVFIEDLDKLLDHDKIEDKFYQQFAAKNVEPQELQKVIDSHFNDIDKLIFEGEKYVTKNHFLTKKDFLLSNIEKDLLKIVESSPIYYMPFPDKRGYFWDDKKSNTLENSSAYILKVDRQNPDKATFTLNLDKKEIVMNAILSYDINLEPVCNILNYEPGGKRITQEGSGSVRKDGNKWMLVEKLDINILN